VGKTVEVEILRAGKKQTMRATIEEQPSKLGP
jgi:hypothetical protein